MYGKWPNCYGQDINPLAILIGETRTGPYHVKAITEKSEALFQYIAEDESDDIEVAFKGLNKWFKPDVALELSKIVRAIRKEKKLTTRRFYWVNLAETVRLTSNDRTSTFKLHARPLEEIELRNPSPIKEFRLRLKKSIEDLELYRNLLAKEGQLLRGAYRGEKKISLQDSSKKILTPGDEKNFFDLLVTSPPYGDNKTTVTYGQHSYLPLQWIDLKDIDQLANKDFLKSTMEIDTRSLGGSIKRLSETQLEKLYIISPAFKIVYQKLLSTSVDRVNKVMVFIQDLFNVVKRFLRS